MDQTNPTPIVQPAAPLPPAYQFPRAIQLFKDAWAIYKKHAWVLIAISAIPLVLVFLAAFFLGLTNALTPTTNGSVMVTGTTAGVIVGVCILVLVYLALLSFAAFIHYITSDEQTASFSQAFQDSYNDVLPLLGAGILTGLAVFGGIILLIIPGIIFAFWFSQTSYVVVTEKLGPIDAMKQSKKYVKGNVGQIFMKGFFIGLISIAAGIVVAIIAGILDGILHTTAISTLGSIVLRIALTPVVTVYTFLLFKQLKNSKA